MAKKSIIISGPAYVVHQYGANPTDIITYFSESDVSVSITKDSKEKKASHLGKYDEILLSSKAEIKFKPIEWDNINALFPCLRLNMGDQTFGESDRHTTVYGAMGKAFKFKRTADMSGGGIGAGVEKDLLAEKTITALRASDADDYDDDKALFEVFDAEFSPRDLDLSKIFNIPYDIVLNGKKYTSEEGVDIDIQPVYTERKRDDVGTWEYLFGGYEATMKFKLTNITLEEYFNVVKPHGGVRRGQRLSSVGFAVSVQGREVGDPKFSCPRMTVAGSLPLNFSSTASLFGEVELRSLSSAVKTPKLSIGVVEEADLIADNEEEG